MKTLLVLISALMLSFSVSAGTGEDGKYNCSKADNSGRSTASKKVEAKKETPVKKTEQKKDLGK